MNEELAFGIKEIYRRIPHRFPMLLVDRMIEIKPGKSGRGIKNVTYNEYYFQGHFPQEPIMPGVLIIECIAQVAAIVLSSSHSHKEGTIPFKPHYLLTIEKAKFNKPVLPGDTMVVDVTVVKKFGGMAKVQGEVNVKSEMVASGVLVVGTGNNAIH